MIILKGIRMTNLKKPAFTMVELVMVIVVLGILAALALPRLDRDLRQEAEDNLLSAIRYTQHLALIDDKTDPRDTNWLQELWQIRFSADGSGGFFYTISSDSDQDGSVDKNETAIDPANGRYMYNLGGSDTIDADESPNIFLAKKYNVDSVALTDGCAAAQHVAFDHLGRPYNSIGTTSVGGASNDYAQYMTSDCTITVGFNDDDIADLIITVAKETGHASAD